MIRHPHVVWLAGLLVLAGSCGDDSGVNDAAPVDASLADGAVDGRAVDAGLSPVDAPMGDAALGPWARRLGGPLNDLITDLVVDGAGDVLVIGQFRDVVDFGAGPVMSSGGADVFVAKYAGADGTHIWSRRFGGAMTDGGQVVAVDAAGDVMIAGVFTGTVAFGAFNLTSTGGLAWDPFFAKLSGSDGGVMWARSAAGDNLEFVLGLTVDAAGDLLASGSAPGTLDLGGGPFPNAGATPNVFVVKYDGSDGMHVWSRSAGSNSASDDGRSVAVDGTGDVFVAGSFETTIDFGLGAVASAGGRDLFVVRFAGTDGTATWMLTAGSVGDDTAYGVTLAGADGFLTGSFEGSVIMGGSTLSSAGGRDVVVARFALGDGSISWARGWGGAGDDGGFAIAVRGSDPVVTGKYSDGADLGSGPLVASGGTDGFVAGYAGPDGVYLGGHVFGGPLQDEGRAVAVDGAEHVVFAGIFEDTVLHGGQLYTSAGLLDGLFGRLVTP